MTESKTLIDDKIDSWAESLTQRIMETNFLDNSEIKTVVKVHFKQAMIESLQCQQSSNQKKRNKLVKQLPLLSGIQKVRLQFELAKLKETIKKENKLFAEIDRDRQAKEMTVWMRENHPESIELFYKSYDERCSLKK